MDKSVIIVLNLRSSTGKHKLIKLFSSYGKIDKYEYHSHKGKPKFIVYYTHTYSSYKAIRDLDGYYLDGKPIGVRFFKPNLFKHREKERQPPRQPLRDNNNNIQTSSSSSHQNVYNKNSHASLQSNHQSHSYFKQSHDPDCFRISDALRFLDSIKNKGL
jgi:RNA recognition motif-containing protein